MALMEIAMVVHISPDGYAERGAVIEKTEVAAIHELGTYEGAFRLPHFSRVTLKNGESYVVNEHWRNLAELIEPGEWIGVD